MRLNPTERKAVEAAFDAAQSRTGAPIGCVLASRSSDYATPPLLWTALLALLTPWLLILFTALSAERIFAAQLGVCLVALVVFLAPAARLALTPRRARRAAAHRAALVQYVARGFDGAPDGNGVLLYVSLAERYVRVVADSRAEHEVGAQAWRALVDRLTRDLAQGKLEDSLKLAAGEIADLLAPAFPRSAVFRPRAPRFHVIGSL